jgi:nucleotide-binding universal stress UspA family protein
MRAVSDQVGLTLDRIVLATDFSPVSEMAGGYARGLSKRFSSSLSLVHVVDLSIATRSGYAVVGLPVDEMRHDSAENQERLQSEMTSAGVRTTAHTLESQNPAASVVSFAKELRADLIVTGTNARRGLSRAILGSCAESIIRHAGCPVMTIGPKARTVPSGALSFHTVVFATDFSSDAGKQAALALSFAQDSVAKIYLCHVLDAPGKDIAETISLEMKFESALERLIPQSTYDWCSPECVVEIGTAAPHILGLAKKVQADLIVLGARPSASWFVNLVEGTVGQVLMSAECPVMTVCTK